MQRVVLQPRDLELPELDQGNGADRHEAYKEDRGTEEASAEAPIVDQLLGGDRITGSAFRLRMAGAESAGQVAGLSDGLPPKGTSELADLADPSWRQSVNVRL